MTEQRPGITFESTGQNVSLARPVRIQLLWADAFSITFKLVVAHTIVVGFLFILFWLILIALGFSLSALAS